MPLFFRHCLLHGRVFHPELGKRIPRQVVTPADLPDGFSLAKHFDDVEPVLDQHIHFRITSRTTPQHHALGLTQRQRLARTHGDQVTLDFGNQSERKAQHLAVDRVVEGVLLLGGVEFDPLPQALSHDGHQIGHRPAQARHLGDDQRIATLHAPQQIAQTPLLLSFFTTDDFVDPDIHLEIPAFGKTTDFILLIGKVLFASAHS